MNLLAGYISEVEVCLKAGKKFQDIGNLDKAKKLFERAVSLAPALPQVSC